MEEEKKNIEKQIIELMEIFEKSNYENMRAETLIKIIKLQKKIQGENFLNHTLSCFRKKEYSRLENACLNIEISAILEQMKKKPRFLKREIKEKHSIYYYEHYTNIYVKLGFNFKEVIQSVETIEPNRISMKIGHNKYREIAFVKTDKETTKKNDLIEYLENTPYIEILLTLYTLQYESEINK